MPPWKEAGEGIVVAIKVTPKASSNQVVGWEGEELRVRIAAVPEKGKANDTLVVFMAKWLGVSRSSVQLLSGDTGRHKKILITNPSSAVKDRLEKL